MNEPDGEPPKEAKPKKTRNPHAAWLKLQRERLSTGRCKQCGAKRDGPSSMFCATHLLIERQRVKERRAARRARGVCISAGCEEPGTTPSGLCPEHYQKQKQCYADWYAIVRDDRNKKRSLQRLERLRAERQKAAKLAAARAAKKAKKTGSAPEAASNPTPTSRKDVSDARRNS